MKTEKIVILGGGTNCYVSNHLSLSAPAYGQTANQLYHMFNSSPELKDNMEVELRLTKMANPSNPSAPDTPEEVEALVDQLLLDPTVRVIVFSVALVDFKPTELTEYRVEDKTRGEIRRLFDKYEERLSTRGTPVVDLELKPSEKIISKIRKTRKDIFLVGFKTVCDEDKPQMFEKALRQCKESSCNLVFVNDVGKRNRSILDSRLKLLDSPNFYSEATELYRYSHYFLFLGFDKELRMREYKKAVKGSIRAHQNNGIVTPEESSYWYNTRREALANLVSMTLNRIETKFLPTTLDLESTEFPCNLQHPFVPPAFKEVLLELLDSGAYSKNLTGNTPGHFGFLHNITDVDGKLTITSFSSIRKRDYSDLKNLRLTRVTYEKEDEIETLTTTNVKASVGDTTQRALYQKYPEFSCIVHFHKPLKTENVDKRINSISQFPAECGGSTCALRTSNAMSSYVYGETEILAVHLEQHGPNIMFKPDANPEDVIGFIDTYWDLSGSIKGLYPFEKQ